MSEALKMTRAEALAEAQRRWGPNAKVFHADEPRPHFVPPFLLMAGAATLKGSGDSWEDAFLDADQREDDGEREAEIEVQRLSAETGISLGPDADARRAE